MNKELLEAVHELEREKQIDAERLLVALEEALRAAYKKTPGAARHVKVEIDREDGEMRVLQVNVPDEILIEKGLLTLPPEPEEDEEPAAPPPPERDRFRDDRFRDDRFRNDAYPPVEEEPEPQLDWERLAEEDIEVVDVTPTNFGRIAAQTAKQVIVQKVREAEREHQFEEFKDRVGQIVHGVVKRVEWSGTVVDLGRGEGIIRREDLIPREMFKQGDRVRAYIFDVRKESRVKMHIPVELQFLAPQYVGLEVEIPGTYRYSGVEWRYPKSALYQDGL